ncbi:MAG: glycosyltransferase [Candidatus Moraniibacteriota bacterium]|nr:MAG: glycosyltransferase [Candidatus Moranbacteria bacterium]
MKKIISLVLNGVTHDSRVKKTARTLAAFGDATVVGFRGKPIESPVLDLGVFSVDRHVVYDKPRPGLKKKIAQFSSTIRFLAHVLLKHRDADLVVCNDLETLPMGVLLRWFGKRGMRVVYDSHEFQTETRWQTPFRKKLTRTVEGWAIRQADASIVVSPSISSEYARIYGIEPPSVVMNCPPLFSVRRTGRLRRALGIPSSSLVFLYQGGLSPGRGVEETVEAFRGLQGNDRVAVFMGYGPLEGWLKDVEKQCTNVRLMPAVPPEEVLEYTADADFGMCLIENVCLNYYYCLPNKLFEYLMAGVPVIVSKLFELDRFVARHGVGIVAEENNAEGIRCAVDAALALDREQLMEKVEAVKQQVSWESQENVWHGIMQDLHFSPKSVAVNELKGNLS